MKLDYCHIDVRPLAGAGGAEIRGLDLRRPIAEDAASEIRRALAQFLLLYIRDQELSDGQLEDFASGFGPLQVHDFVRPVPGHPFMIGVERKADEDPAVRIVGEDWHADAPWLERPVAGSILYSLESPPWGGDTQFCNLYLAYDSLSKGLQQTIEPLILQSAAAAGASYLTSVKGSSAMSYDMKDLDKEGEHPLVRVHPVTGRKILAITGPYGYCIKGWTPEESRPLLDFLLRQATRAEHVFRVRWETGTVAVWDNRCTLHQAIKDYQGFARRLRRLQFGGERPFGPARPAADQEPLFA